MDTLHTYIKETLEDLEDKYQFRVVEDWLKSLLEVSEIRIEHITYNGEFVGAKISFVDKPNFKVWIDTEDGVIIGKDGSEKVEKKIDESIIYTLNEAIRG